MKKIIKTVLPQKSLFETSNHQYKMTLKLQFRFRKSFTGYRFDIDLQSQKGVRKKAINYFQ